jgi:hypothetical protein
MFVAIQTVHTIVLGWFMLCACAFAVPQPLTSNPATVTGQVFYKNGAPVDNAEVQVRTFGPIGGILPPPVRTDTSGRYTIVYPPLGEGFISASKISEGYPNAAIALYDGRNSTSLRRIDLQPGARLDQIDLRFGDPSPVVDFEVKDTASGRPVENARILVQWPDAPNIMTSQSIPSDGVFTLVLPKHSIEVKISAPGHKDWHWRNTTAATKAFGPPGVHNRVVVSLTPSIL